MKTALLVLMLVLNALILQAQSPTAVNQVKAVFLFNFTQFVTWPSFSFNGNHAPFVIGVLGTDPFGQYLDNVVEGEQVDGHPIIVKRYDEAKEAKECHILFINKSNPAEALKEVNTQGILTVSDADNFARKGGMIRFSVENNRIRLQINARAAKEASLSISSKLLRLANVINAP
ncbi:MAG TPA: YfiR family protein [Flavisolibacter sp.]|nr:YfiR family protein [Flavisolibacter sp.]